MTEPLKVRVARALGWTEIREYAEGVWAGRPPRDYVPGPERFVTWTVVMDEGDQNAYHVIPPYGDETPEGWACTGPLIERYGLQVIRITGLSICASVALLAATAAERG